MFRLVVAALLYLSQLGYAATCNTSASGAESGLNGTSYHWGPRFAQRGFGPEKTDDLYLG